MTQPILVFLAAAATFSAMTLAPPCTASAAPAEANLTTASPEAVTTRLNRIYDDAWQRWLREDPTLATGMGDSRYNDRWPDLSPAAIQKTNDADQAALAALRAIDSARLAVPDRLNYDIVKFELERRLALARFKPRLWWISQLGSVQTPNSLQTASEIAEISPFATVRDYENWIARLRGFGAYLDQNSGPRKAHSASCDHVANQAANCGATGRNSGSQSLFRAVQAHAEFHSRGRARTPGRRGKDGDIYRGAARICAL
jgi:uncharacterized protein (DUF885 family)